MNTSRIHVSLTLAFALVLSASALAQMGGMGGPPGGRHRQMMSPADQLKRLDKELKLTDEQKPKIQAILEDQEKQAQQLMSDSSSGPQEKMPKMREIHENSSAQIRALLTDQQQVKYDAM
jgi:protein CpxP